MTFGYENEREFRYVKKEKKDVRGQTLIRIGMMAQKRLEWLNRDFKTYVRHKKTRTEEGSGEQRIGTSLRLNYDMYSLLYVTTMHPEYLHVLQKAKERED